MRLEAGISVKPNYDSTWYTKARMSKDACRGLEQYRQDTEFGGGVQIMKHSFNLFQEAKLKKENTVLTKM